MSRRVERVRGRIARLGVVVGAGLMLAHCSNSNIADKVDPRYGVVASPRVADASEPIPKGGGVYRVGKPYVVAGQVYTPEENPHYRAEGIASWYGEEFHGRQTANGEVYDLEGISAAHPTMPLPSYARVTNLGNGRSLIVRVNDRGPYHGNRVIDVSMKAAHLLGFHRHGTAPVRVEYVGPAPLAGSDDRILAATLRQNQPAPPPAMVASAKSVFPEQPPPPSRLFARTASVAPMPPPNVSSRGGALGYAPAGFDGTAQFMSGRGLY
jgi:rare lipoprotein A